MADPATIASRLTPHERELLSGAADGWGSWMYECGLDLVSKGLGRVSNGSIHFDTPLGLAVRALISED